MIGIVDYGMGNLHSVTKGLERIGHTPFLSEKIEELEKADKLILPGVGSFRDGMRELQERGLDTFLQEWAQSGRQLLGICLGMQLLFEESEENGQTTGLSLLRGGVKRFSGKGVDGVPYKVPHMGWNRLTFQQEGHPILKDVPNGHVYFVHSYVVQVADEAELIASSEYGNELVPAVVGQGNVWGTQFHPEKSSVLGMQMLKNFAEYKEGAR
ncbi:imidazole glycerol phosphate synthase subunit HisH [Evansella cellulosilytica]|uniref:Imidazole glycerol phosphate synthase subunit HisH n=1 Tax=Evansella cellulosilytica (strain ATCC 21833 / DSM 2522 / FERM P-1141 / JCM 9156 / N-4) TaxID=649639 RepID=E6TRE7_EVAC2|nr:imidazole glycerol phosphate synthase subunit HisH [Evansella cellulosilytica]ADU31777.1 imidazole glycerol phosphate synthase, glutamine amidotransferase subunit [Evansella cellulosilytica DSM 2522]